MDIEAGFDAALAIVPHPPAKRLLGDYGTFVPTPVVPASGAKGDSDATTGKVDHGH
jgi:hypothetical protein